MKKATKLSDDQVAAVISAVGDANNPATVAGEARRLGVARSTLRNAIESFERRNTDQPQSGVQEEADGGLTITSEPRTVAGVELTEDALMQHYGLDPAEHVVVRKRLNFWGSDDDPRFQLRLDAIPKDKLFMPPLDREWLPAPDPIALKPGEPTRWVYMGDHHFPYVDHGLMQTSLQYLRDTQPHVIVLGGDLLNNGAWARHRSRPRFVEEANAGIRGAGGYVRALRKACPDARIIWIPGNHDQWIEQRLIEDRSAALGFRGFSDTYDVLDLRRLVDIDPVHVEFVDMDWDLAFFPITDKLTAMHGPPGGKSGKNALDAIFDKLTGSGVFGHTHRGGMRYKTRHNPATGETESHVAIEAFMMARHHKGMGYAGQPDWTQGFVYGAAWADDGTFTAAPAFYNEVNAGGTLLLPDGTRYQSTIDKFGEPV